MKQALLISAAGLLFLGAVEAQEQPRLVIRTQKNGKQVTTTLEPVFPPAAKAPGDKKGDPALPKEVGRATATGVVLAAMDWKCGREFTDEKGRRWRLVNGNPLALKPNQVSGWIL